MSKQGLVPSHSTASYPTLVEASTTRRSFLAGLVGLGGTAILLTTIDACGPGGIRTWPDASHTDGLDAQRPPPDARPPDARPPDAHWIEDTAGLPPDAHLPDDAPSDTAPTDADPPDGGTPDAF